MEITVGRNSSQSMVVVPREYDSVSGFHLQIEQQGGDWFITDQNSSNGTEVEVSGKWKTAPPGRMVKVKNKAKLRLAKEYITSVDELVEMHLGQVEKTTLQVSEPTNAKKLRKKRPVRQADGSLIYVYVDESK